MISIFNLGVGYYINNSFTGKYVKTDIVGSSSTKVEVFINDIKLDEFLIEIINNKVNVLLDKFYASIKIELRRSTTIYPLMFDSLYDPYYVEKYFDFMTQVLQDEALYRLQKYNILTTFTLGLGEIISAVPVENTISDPQLNFKEFLKNIPNLNETSGAIADCTDRPDKNGYSGDLINEIGFTEPNIDEYMIQNYIKINNSRSSINNNNGLMNTLDPKVFTNINALENGASGKLYLELRRGLYRINSIIPIFSIGTMFNTVILYIGKDKLLCNVVQKHDILQITSVDDYTLDITSSQYLSVHTEYGYLPLLFTYNRPNPPVFTECGQQISSTINTITEWLASN